MTYVPSTAPVRSKTLFASTRSTLIRELGQEKFSRQVFCTEAHEILDPQEWAEREGRATSDVSSARDDLLTREERELQGVKRAEDEERHGTSGRDIGWGGGTGKPGGGGSVGMKMKLDDGVQQALGSLGEDGQVVQLVRQGPKCLRKLVSNCVCWTQGIDLPTETIKLRLSESNVAPSKLPSVIPEAEPSYTFYNYPSSGIIFIYTCPASTSVKGRMVYASSRNNVVSLAKENGLEVSKRIEAGEPEDITESRLKEEMDPKVEVETKSGFARPKRPGRR